MKTLLVDRNYMAISIITWKKAVKLLVNGKAENIYEDCIKINTSNKYFGLSTVLRLIIDIPWRASSNKLRFSKKNIMLRDNYTCKYCNLKLNKGSGTIDHVIPRSRGGKTNYTNCVTSCKKCNNFKGNRTPEQAGMRLKSPPKPPNFAALYRDKLTDMPAEWADYLIGI